MSAEEVYVFLHRAGIHSNSTPSTAINWEHRQTDQSERFTLTGYDIPGCVEDGAWMLWENSSVAAVAAAVAVAHPGLGRGQLSVLLRLRRFRDARIDPSRLPSTDGFRNMESRRMRNSTIKKTATKTIKTANKSLA